MAVLTTKARKKLPSKDFALPGKKAFPLEDKSHAVAAERLVGRAEKAGSITPAQADEVKEKAAKKLGKSGSTHSVGDLEHDNSMQGYHHDDMKHTSGDR
jgi:hypothetical protein